MKLLLTSSGITNHSIANALFELTGKKPEETTIVFIPTASNIEIGDKDWLITDLLRLKELHFKSIEITDISAVDEKLWKASFERADVLFFEWWNSYHLMRRLHTSGLTNTLPELLKDKIYVGVSAGSMVTSSDLSLTISQKIYEEDLLETDEIKGLDFVDFYFLPHLHSQRFPNVRKDFIEEIGKNIPKTLYALDDNSALKIIDNTIEVISEGERFVINK